MDRPHTTPETFGAVRDWANTLLDQAHQVGPTPVAGSTHWSRLEEHDPRKPAAVVRAALAWLRDGSREAITARLASELDSLDRHQADRDKATARDLSAAVDWSAFAAGPTERELHRRRTTYPCPRCRTALAFTAHTCGACGWTEPTPTQLRAAARQSWTRYNPLENAA